MRQTLGAFLKDQSGATAIEYVVMAAFVAAVAVPAASLLGGSLSEAFAELSSALTPPATPGLTLTGNSRPV